MIGRGACPRLPGHTQMTDLSLGPSQAWESPLVLPHSLSPAGTPPPHTHTPAHALPAGAPQGQLAQVFLLVSLRFVLSTYIFTHLTNYNMNLLQKKKKKDIFF